MNILIVDTGNPKLDEAYKRMQVHISAYDSIESFESYFNSITKDIDKEVLNTWLLKVLYWEFKYGRDKKHDFDVLIESLQVNEPIKANNLRKWLFEALKEIGGK